MRDTLMLFPDDEVDLIIQGQQLQTPQALGCPELSNPARLWSEQWALQVSWSQGHLASLCWHSTGPKDT